MEDNNLWIEERREYTRKEWRHIRKALNKRLKKEIPRPWIKIVKMKPHKNDCKL